ATVQRGADAHATAAAQRNAVLAAATVQGVTLTPQEADYLVSGARRRAMLDAVRRAYARWLSAGIAAGATVDNLRGDVIVRRQGQERSVMVDSLLSFASLLSRSRAFEPDPNSSVASALYLKLLSAFFRPTVTLDQFATEQRRREGRWRARSGRPSRVREDARAPRRHAGADARPARVRQDRGEHRLQRARARDLRHRHRAVPSAALQRVPVPGDVRGRVPARADRVRGGGAVAARASGAGPGGAGGHHPERALRFTHQHDRGDDSRGARGRAERVPGNERAVHQPRRRRRGGAQ